MLTKLVAKSVERATAVRLLAMLLMSVLVLAACGEVDSNSPPTGTTSAQVGGGLQATSTQTSSVTMPEDAVSPTVSQPTSTATSVVKSPTATSSPTRQEKDSEAPGTPITITSTPTKASRPEATPEPVEKTPEPTATMTAAATATESTPAVFPTFPPIPEITSCEHAADLMIETMQIWLDALVYLPEDAFVTGGPLPPEFEQFSADLEAYGTETTQTAEQIGCSEEEIQILFYARLDQLVANNPTAEWILALLLEEYGGTSEPIPTTPSIEVDWTIETCEDAANVFIDLVQTLLLDEIAGMTSSEVEAMEEPEYFLRFIQEFTFLREEFFAIGCTEDEVTVLIGERLDQLVPVGEAAEEVVASIREAIEANELFEGLDY